MSVPDSSSISTHTSVSRNLIAPRCPLMFELESQKLSFKYYFNVISAVRLLEMCYTNVAMTDLMFCADFCR